MRFLASGKSPTCPSVGIEEDMVIALEPTTRQDLPYEPIKVTPTLPWQDTFHPTFVSCNILCHPSQSDIKPYEVDDLEYLRLMTLTRPQVERRNRFIHPNPRYIPTTSDTDSEDEADSQNNEIRSARTSNSAVAEEEDRQALAIRTDPLAALWWSMGDTSRDYSEWPTVQLSADLSLVHELSDPFDFAREHHALLKCVLLDYVVYHSSFLL